MVKQKQHNQTWKVGAVVVAAIAAAALLVLWFYAWAPPTSADYRSAQKQTGTLLERMMEVDAAANTYSEAIGDSLRFEPTGNKLASDTAKQKRAYTAAADEYKSQLMQLQSAAAARDRQLKPVIARVSADTKKYEVFLSNMVKDYPSFYKTRIACSVVDQAIIARDLSVSSSQIIDGAQDCIKSIGALKNARLSVFREYGVNKSQGVVALKQTYEQLAMAGANAKVLNAKLATQKIDLLKIDPLTDLQDARDKVMNHVAIDSLERLLKKKQQG